MAKSSRVSAAVKSARNTLIWLVIIVAALAGLNWVAVAFQGGVWTPKLALDLEGGTQVVLEAQLEEGATPSGDQMSQAVQIIRQRVDASGVSEAEITTQGGKNVVVSVPGEMDEETRARIESSAMLEFRPVLFAEGSEVIQEITPEMMGMEPTETFSSEPSGEAADASDTVQVSEQMMADFYAFNCADLGNRTEPSASDQPMITCDSTGTEKFILGPVEITGSNIKDATNGVVTTSQGATTGQWAVNLEFDATGTEQFRAVTERLYAIGNTVDQNTGTVDTNRSRFAVTMDDIVIVAPTANAVITDGKAQITNSSGTFTEASTKALADQLKFGALPFSFETQSTQTISATLGTWQLQAGLIAGAIGMGLVLIYSLFQYRTLGLVTMTSLGILGGVTYLVVTFLSNQEGYRLSLAGVAGLIVAIGITADSFIVYFERIKDELREGKSLATAVEHGWSRAIRTILASDTVNLLVAIVLAMVAVGNVRGFAITLGITTLIDLFVVVMFTHPLMRLLATTKFFGGGHPASGLNPESLGAVYRGRGEFRTSTTKRKSGASHEAQRRQTIAERKAAELSAAGKNDES
ncbi:protein translocase subunit SecD [Gulosibacter chungangensis]|uniref:Protein translocase subunit SecD n=1 Tax=Gulosibacter chungangensis TaxID=979746 RepID=A0A7J5BCW6_9MICO|nr:protein translocase subunit SecD [Gulosibacter chungangensis]KAB1644055.1 protein translocase subunit SecD [Gulosibacter chungangensis]